ncbi:MAG: hypothetical protein KAI53_03510 [Candidatus Aenigmarchaeota archaeon]|nr:hypothetical protein [Candidatus Aenigmarchaeota archaeon]
MCLKHFVFIVFLFLLVPSVDAATCNLKYGTCGGAESTLFSLYNWTNAHVSESGTLNYNWSVCCDIATTIFSSNCYVNTSNGCASGEGDILSLFTKTNAHAEVNNTLGYSNKVCCDLPGLWDDFYCYYNTTGNCATSETAVVSMYNYTNSHLGNLSAYNNILCCKTQDVNPPTVIVTYPSVVPSTSISFGVTCTDTGGSGGCNRTIINTTYGNCTVLGGGGTCTIAFPPSSCIYNLSTVFDVYATDLVGNSNYAANYGSFDINLADGCDCSLAPTECFSFLLCIEGICSSSGNEPFIGFDVNNTHVIELGKTGKIYVIIKNPTPTKKSVPLYIGSFDVIKNWMWFEGHKYDTRRNITMTIDAYAEKVVVINVLGGKTGDYSIVVGPDSDYATRYDEINIRIVSKKDGAFFSSTPGLGLISLFFIILAGAFLR